MLSSRIMATARTDCVDDKAILELAGRLRDLLCRECRTMRIYGDLYRSTRRTIDSIDELAERLTGKPGYFVGRSPRA